MKDDKNKKKVNANELLGKIRPYLQDESIVAKHNEYVKNGEDSGFDTELQISESSKYPMSTDQESEGPVSEEDIADNSEEFARFLAHEAKMLHGNMEEDDFDLMSIFGVEGEKEREEDTKEPEKKEKRKIKEIDLSNTAQRKRVERIYKKRFAQALAGIIGTLILFLFSAVTEGAAALGFDLPEMLCPNHYPQIALVIAIQVLVLAVAMQYKLYFRSLKQLFSAKPDSGVIFVIYSAVFAVYYCVLLAFGVRENIVLYNSVLTLSALFSLFSELVYSCSVCYNIKVAGMKGQKYAMAELDKKQSRDARELVGRYLTTETPYLAVTETLSTNDFCKRINGKSSLRKIIPVLLAVSAIAGVLFGVYALYGRGWHGSLKYALNVFLMAMPLSCCLIFSYPAYAGNRRLVSAHATVIGERSFEKYKTPACLILTDKYMFTGDGSVSLAGIKGYGEVHIDTALGYAAAVFSKLDCPLGKVFMDTASDYRLSTDVDVAYVDENGIEAAVEGSSVLIGNYDFVNYHKALPGVEKSPDEIGYYDTYIVVDKSYALRVTLKYTPSDEFVKTVKSLVRKDVNIIIRTCDPNISMDSLEELAGITRVMPVRILRIKDHQNAKYDFRDECPSGLVSCAGFKELTRAFAESAKVGRAMKAGVFFAILSTAVSLVILGVVTGAVGCREFASLIIVAYQLLWILPALLVGKLLL